MKYTTPEIEIMELSQTDVIEASGNNSTTPENENNGLGWG